MAMTPSTMMPLGTAAPDFRLPDLDGSERGARWRSGDDKAETEHRLQHQMEAGQRARLLWRHLNLDPDRKMVADDLGISARTFDRSTYDQQVG